MNFPAAVISTLHTNVADSRGDQLVVNNNATGNFKIFVQDTGVSPQSDDAMTLVKTGGGDASFTLGNTGGFVDLGTYEYVLKSDGNSNWNLTNDVKPNPDPNPNPKPDQNQTQNRIRNQTRLRSNADTRPGESHHAFYSSRTQYGSNITVGL